MRFAPFTVVDVEHILRASEKQAGPGGGGIGHAGAKHVSIEREALLDRMRSEKANKAGLAIYTSFLRFRDQIAAVHAALNAGASAALLNAFYDPKAPDGTNLALENIVIRNAIEVRVALGGDGPATRMSSFVTIYGRKMHDRPREMHIVTAFATFEPLSIGSLPDRP